MKRFTYIVIIDTDTQDHADTVIAERLGHDEDYGFDYRITDHRLVSAERKQDG